MTSHKYGFSRYLPVNKEALRWEIYCNDAGYSQVPPGADYPLRPQEHPEAYAATVATGRILREFQVIYITAGKGWFEDHEGHRQDVRAGDMLMLFPGIRHAYSPLKDTGWQEYWVGFAGEHADRLYKNGLFEPGRPIHHIGINQDIMADYEQIIHLCRQQIPGFQVLLGALVLQLMAHIHASEMSRRTSHKDSELVQTARSIMQLHLEEGIEVEQIARELGVRPVYCRKISSRWV